MICDVCFMTDKDSIWERLDRVLIPAVGDFVRLRSRLFKINDITWEYDFEAGTASIFLNCKEDE